jgi:hypothetical protein
MPSQISHFLFLIQWSAEICGKTKFARLLDGPLLLSQAGNIKRIGKDRPELALSYGFFVRRFK